MLNGENLQTIGSFSWFTVYYMLFIEMMTNSLMGTLIGSMRLVCFYMVFDRDNGIMMGYYWDIDNELPSGNLLQFAIETYH